MAWVSTLIHMDYVGSLRRQVYSFVATGVTSGNIVTGISSIKYTELHNKTAQRGVVDDTTTAGTVAISSVTDGDAGYVTVWGT